MSKTLSEQVAELEAERDELKSENAELRAGQGRWPEKADDFPCCRSQPTGYADEDHQDAEVTQWHQPTPRLTVHDLEVAPVGSVVANGKGFEVMKDTRGDWVLGHHPHNNARYSAAELMQWADATLTYPEGQR